MYLVLSGLKEIPLLTAYSSPSASSMLFPFAVLKVSNVKNVIQPKLFLEINS